MKKIISVFLITVLITCIFSSCKKEEEDSEIYYPVTKDFVSLDPQIATDDSSKLVAYNCYEGLVRVDENGKIVPAGAATWSVSADSLTYIFNLRRDAKWYFTNTSKEELSNADPAQSAIDRNFDTRVTAKDYVFGLKRAVDPATGAADGKYLTAIKNAADILNSQQQADNLGVEAIDDYTLKITLDYADPNFLFYLTRLAAMPCNEQFFNACKGRYGLAMEYLLCNGAYMVYRWTQGTVVRLEKNPLYTGEEKALNDRVWIYYVEDETTVAEKIKNGTYDVGYVSAHDSVEFTDSKKFNTKARNDVLWGFWFNSANEDFSVTELRLAFASVVDKNLLVAPDHITTATDRIMLDSITPLYDYTPHLIAYDEQKAADYYKKAMENSENITASMTVSVLTTEDFADCVKKQIQLWQKIFGIDVKIQIETRETAVKLMSSGNYQIAFLPVTATATNTAEYFRTFMSTSDYNVTGYANSNYDSLINSLTDTMTEKQKNEVYKSCEQTLISHGVVVPAFTEASYFITSADVSGVYSFSESEIYFRNGTFI